MIAMQIDDGGGGTIVPPAAIAAPEPAPEPAPTQSIAAIEHAAETAPAADAAKGAAEIVPEPAKEAPLPEAPRPEVVEAPAPAPAPAEAAAPAPAPEAAPQADAPAAEAPKGEEPAAEAPKGIEAEAPKSDAPQGEGPKGDAPKGDAPEGGAKGVDTAAEKSGHGNASTSHDDDGASKSAGGGKGAEDAGFQGKAADQVKALKAATDKIVQDQAKTDAARKEAASKLDHEQAEAKKTEGEAKLQAWNPLNFLAPLVGLEAPKTAWTSHDEHVKAAEDSSKDLSSAAQEAARLDRNHDRTTESLGDARDLNAQVQVAFSVGDIEAAKQIDSADAATFVEADTSIIGAAAEYDSEANKVVIPAAFSEKTRSAREALVSAGALTEDGFAVEPNTITDSAAGKQLLGQAAVTNHELTHKADDSAGKIDATNAKVEMMVLSGADEAAALVEAGASTAEADTAQDAANIAAAKLVMAETEYGPNLAQEQLERAGGKSSFPVMLDADGAQLPKHQQLQNLWNMYTNTAMTYGPSAGKVMPNSGAAISEADFAASLVETEAAAGRNRPGRNRPGRNRP